MSGSHETRSRALPTETARATSDAPPPLLLVARAVGTLGASSIIFASLFVGSVLIARMLGVEARGVVAAAVLLPTIVAYAGELGVSAAAGYLIGERRTERGVVVGTALTLATGLSAVLVLVSLVLTLIVPLPDSARGLAFVFALFVPLNLLQRVFFTVLQAELRMNALNAVRVAGGVVYVGGLAALPALGADSTRGAVAALLVGNAVWLALSAALVARGPLRAWDDAVARRLLGYGLRAHLGSMSPLDSLRLDQLVLAIFLPAHALGLYVTAASVALSNRLLGVSFGIVAFPVAARTPRGHGRPVLLRLVAATGLLSAAAAAIEIVFGRDLLRIFFPPEFADAYAPLVILVLASVLMNVRGVTGDWLRGRGRPGAATIAEAVSLAVLLPGFVVLWNGEVTGVATVVLVASAASLAVTAAFARRWR
jgi:O-antigen/teichoic acid export membrane protein